MDCLSPLTGAWCPPQNPNFCVLAGKNKLCSTLLDILTAAATKSEDNKQNIMDLEITYILLELLVGHKEPEIVKAVSRLIIKLTTADDSRPVVSRWVSPCICSFLSVPSCIDWFAIMIGNVHHRSQQKCNPIQCPRNACNAGFCVADFLCQYHVKAPNANICVFKTGFNELRQIDMRFQAVCRDFIVVSRNFKYSSWVGANPKSLDHCGLQLFLQTGRYNLRYKLHLFTLIASL